MDNVFFDNPPVLQGDERTQLAQLNGYLFTISNKLNEALMTVSTAESAAQQAGGIRTPGSATAPEKAEDKQYYNTLKSMIVKTAEIVRTEMQEISVRLESETEAISEQFGAFQQNLEQEITDTAEGLLQSYHFEEVITDAQTGASFSERTSQYIFTGLLETDPEPKYGLAIGENITGDDGELNTEAKVATFTMDEMAFWEGETKLAYFSSGKFYIANGEITETLTVGGFHWKVLANGSMALIKT